MKPTFILCGVCNGKREVVDGLCSGCAGEVAKVRMSAPKPKPIQCPRCGPKGSTYKLQRGTYHCRRCSAEFEPVEYSFTDSRPDVNAEKRERGMR